MALSGVGIGLRRELYDALLSTPRKVDWLELITENFLGLEGRPAEMLGQLAGRWPLIPHGVGLSVGSAAPAGYLEALGPFLTRLDAPYFSDHLCFSSLGARTWFCLLYTSRCV